MEENEKNLKSRENSYQQSVKSHILLIETGVCVLTLIKKKYTQ